MKNRTLNKAVQNGFLLLILLLPGVLVFNRCANQGMPTGGPKDSIPPVLVETSPAFRSLDFKGKEVRITFDEYIVPDAVSEELIVSPPLSKRPNIRTKSKSLIVAFNEELKPDVTYSMDFKNSIVDNNERNPFLGLRLLFSTGSRLDTLRIAGVVKDAQTLEPKEKISVALYSNLNDTAVTHSKPDYIAKTDSRGIYLFDNVKPGKYNLFALNDANNNFLYDPGAEEFAFCDSVIVPSAEYKANPDTLVFGADSMLIAGHTVFKPDPVYLRTFTEDFFEQYIDKSIRETRYKCIFSFGEPVKDTLRIRLLNREADHWYLLEHNPEMDSLTVWLTDSLVARYDTLKLELAYTQLDSLKNKYIKLDTLHLVYAEKEKQEPRKKKKDEIPEVVQFNLASNLKSSGFNLNSPILITSPEPVKSFAFSGIRLTLAADTTRKPLGFTIKEDTTEWRTYRLDYKWEPDTEYLFEIDSAACVNIFGITSRKFKQQFTTQKEDHYGRIILNLGSVDSNLLVQLLNNSKEEKVLKTLTADKNGKVIFDFLDPEKYKIRIIFDRNRNGKWDTGNYSIRLQPERVAYLPEIIKVRSNWDKQIEWDLKPDPTFRKNLIDKEEEELRLKKLKEQQQKDKKKERESPDDSYEQQFGNPGNF